MGGYITTIDINAYPFSRLGEIINRHPIPGIFDTDLNELLDFVKHRGLSKEFVDWKFKR